MSNNEQDLASYWGSLRCESPQCLGYNAAWHGDAQRLRQALRQSGVPVLELNQAPICVADVWLAEAEKLSAEFLMPVFVFGADLQQVTVFSENTLIVTDQAWLEARQVALTAAIDKSPLHQEWRRHADQRGKVFVGWQPEADLQSGNGLLLAWSSPLPLLRLRNFAARCPALEIQGAEVSSLMAEIAAQGICVSRWRIAVK